jgi:hypothetical protein
MCTVTWTRERQTLHVFFNRDELLGRAAGVAPRIEKTGEVSYVSPRDPDGQGTWFAVNDRGIAACVLNAPGDGNGARRSRGEIPLAAMAHISARAAAAEVAAMPMNGFRPFRLLVIGPEDEAAVEYDGTRAIANYAVPGCMMTSSSLDDAEARRRRSAEFDRRFCGREAVTVGGLREFHGSHEGGRSAFSVCMHREDARTLSQIHVEVGPDAISMDYLDAAPCAGEGGRRYSVRMARRGS